ncbi:hypothetical protein [Phreatobacter stygius]|uniref:Argininosuccinate lyase n=1 Tax=Phreatobacter stygius TaxID=1940610 RepID=A0A4D7BIP4_9HYPH|nr:hypothetical protein [Phreatobacter stygius]QCI68896.1 hypothetical protein E8M01_34490 [Phreatobacter stygius]
MRRRLFLASLAAASVVVSTEAFAQAQQNFSLVNRTGFQVNEVYVSPSANNNWGRDILGDGVMPSGTRRNITFPRRTQACMFDLRIVYDDGDKSEAREINLCQVSNVTLTWTGRGTRFSYD